MVSCGRMESCTVNSEVKVGATKLFASSPPHAEAHAVLSPLTNIKLHGGNVRVQSDSEISCGSTVVKALSILTNIRDLAVFFAYVPIAKSKWTAL